MTRFERGEPGPRLQAFISLARRANWSLPRAQRTLIWERLQTARGARPAAASFGLAFLGIGGGRPLTQRTLILTAAAGVLVMATASIIVRNVNRRPWHQEVQLGRGGDEPVLAMGHLRGPGDFGFSDGTRIGVQGTSQVVVDAVSAQGAEIRLDRGALDAYVRPRPNARWTFGAGPFRLEVKGTSFNLDWRPDTDRMTLRMWSGVVVVHGGKLHRSVTVGAGESITVTGSAEAAVLLPPATSPPGRNNSSSSPPGSPSSSSSNSSSTSPVGSHAAGDSTPVSARLLDDESLVAVHRPPAWRSRDRRVGGRELANTKDSWTALLARGAFVEIVEQATKRGIDTTLAHCSDVDIAAFADAARYTRQNQLARRGLLALRTRFPTSERARNGAFFLGRLGESNEGDIENALAWYDRYLRESPDGAYVEGAMAREMILLRPHRSQGRAKTIAERYLKTYPNGTYRDLALTLRGDEVR